MNPEDENSGSPDENPSLSDIPQGSTPKSTSFKDAFASARSGGEKTFTWNGKSYTTQLANEKPKTVSTQSAQINSKAQEPSFEDRVNAIKEAKGYTSPSDRIPQGSASGNKGPGGVSNIDSTELGRNVSNAMNALTPLGGGVAKIGAELAMAGRGAKTASKVAEVAEKGREAVTNPAAWTGGPKAMKTIQKVEDAANKVADKASKAVRASKKRTSGNIPDKDTNGGAIGYKRGGSTGGRGDGIARKGHTKGRYL